MKVKDLIYALYQIVHKHGNLDVYVLDKDLNATNLKGLGTNEFLSPEGIRKGLFLMNKVTSFRALSESNNIKGLVPEKIDQSNVINIYTRKKDSLV